MPIPKAVIAGPDWAPLPYGLFSTFTFRDAGDGRWETGGTFETEACSPIGGVPAWTPYDPGEDPEDPAPNPNVKDLTREDGEHGEAVAFTVYGHKRIDVVSTSFAEAQVQAQARLLRGEEKRVEQALWTGDLGNSPSLAGPGATPAKPLGTTATAPAQAVAVLEDWLADVVGSLGVLHMSRWAASHLLEKGIAEVRNGRLYTLMGTPIAAGSGYPGTGEGVSVSGYAQQWIFATPTIFGYRSEVFGPDAPVFDPKVNDTIALAERTYLLAMDTCGTAGVLMTPDPVEA